jgi:carboxyl-terminal processing protease
MRFTHFFAIIFAAILLLPNSIYSQSRSQKADPSETTQKMAAVLFYIENYYVDTANVPKLVEDAIVSILKDLDPHSAYISKEEINEANEPLEGNFEGIGVTFQLYRDTILVIAPVPGGPSDKLGIQAGDKIIQIDGKDAFGKDVNNRFVMDRLRGQKGTTVDVSIYRKGNDKLHDYTIVRDKIPLHSIDATFMIDDEIGYIKLNRFSKTTMEEFRESIANLKAGGMKSLILDLRGNSGGFLGTAVELADEFLMPGKLLVYTEGLNNPRQEFNATRRGSFEDGKLIVMINEGSASASEIVAGAVQDWDRGIVLGRRSFGKGLVQRPFQLPDGSVIRLTSATYFTPTGRSIQRPYQDGTESYYRDLRNRFQNGELVHADSIKFPDSLKYLTPGNRVVYGGGGIMPDLFVPWDSTQVTTYYSNLVRKGVFNGFTIDYVNDNRNKLRRNYPDFQKFKSNFKVDADMMDAFLARAGKEGVEFVEEDFEKSENYIRYQVKALIARNLWQMSNYFEVVAEVDDTLLQAVHLLKNNTSYSQLLEAR